MKRGRLWSALRRLVAVLCGWATVFSNVVGPARPVGSYLIYPETFGRRYLVSDSESQEVAVERKNEGRIKKIFIFDNFFLFLIIANANLVLSPCIDF